MPRPEDDYIARHATDRVSDLALQLTKHPELDSAYILRQIEGRQRIAAKVPRWAQCEGIAYPVRLSLEQCSSEATAEYKAGVVARLLRERGLEAQHLVDLTGGMGVDFSFLAPLFVSATYVERDEALCAAARLNFPLLGLRGATVVQGEAQTFLPALPPVTLLYLDPARRDAAGRKTVLIADCSPSLTDLLPQLLAKAPLTLAKLSPMLDIALALEALANCVSEVHVVGAEGECKELLLVVERTPRATQIVVAEGETRFCFTRQEEQAAAPRYAASPSAYIYEPSAAVLKAGAFKTVAVRYGLKKFHTNSHLYTGAQRVNDFPGRTFQCIGTYGFDKASLRALRADHPRANLTTRGFPLAVPALRKKLRIAEGGDTYIYATTQSEGRHLLLACKKVEESV